MVLSPTRELALQIAEEVRKYEYHGIKSVCVYGGGDRRAQMKVTCGRNTDLSRVELSAKIVISSQGGD